MIWVYEQSTFRTPDLLFMIPPSSWRRVVQWAQKNNEKGNIEKGILQSGSCSLFSLFMIIVNTVLFLSYEYGLFLGFN